MGSLVPKDDIPKDLGFKAGMKEIGVSPVVPVSLQDRRNKSATELRQTEGVDMDWVKETEQRLKRKDISGTERDVLRSEFKLNTGIDWKDRKSLKPENLVSRKLVPEDDLPSSSTASVETSPKLFLGARLKEMLFGKETIASTEP